MFISAKLDFNTNKKDVRNLIYSAKIDFSSDELNVPFTVEEVNTSVLQQIEKSGKGTFYAAKANAPFKVTIDCENEKVIVEPIPSKNPEDLTFYLYRTLEICNNFAIYELEATK